MENYIVRIYRRTSGNPDKITGVVEKPDSGKNVAFHSNEEFVNIFTTLKSKTRRNNIQQVFEQREYRRFNVKNSTLIFDDTTDVGEIIEISLGGVSFFCPNMPEELKGSFRVDILCEGLENFCAGKINCRKLMLRHPGQYHNDSRKRFSIVFDALSDQQKSQVEQIIRNYAVSEA